MKNVVGMELSDPQIELMEIYQKLVNLLREKSDQLNPFELCNARKAAAALWQTANGLDIDPGQLYDIGV